MWKFILSTVGFPHDLAAPSLAFLSPSRLRAGLAAITWGDFSKNLRKNPPFYRGGRALRMVWLSDCLQPVRTQSQVIHVFLHLGWASQNAVIHKKSAVRICQNNQQLEFIWESKCGSATLAEDSMGYNWCNHKICCTQISKLEVNCWNTWIRHSWIHGFMPHQKSAKKTRRRTYQTQDKPKV